MNATTKITAAAIADQLGMIKAQIAPLQKQEKALKEQFLASGETVGEGISFLATRVEADRTTLNSGKVKALLADLVASGAISRQKAAAMYNRTETLSVRVTAKKTS